MSDLVTYRSDEGVAVITLDDGKVNVVGPDMQAAVNEALDRAGSDEAHAIVLAGNGRVLSAGFDLKVLQSGDVDAAIAMLQGGFRLMERIFASPVPVVIASTGHAIAMGSFLLAAGDHRLVQPASKVQANESLIGMPVPYPVVEVLRLRLTPAAFQHATTLATVYVGAEAVAVGWADEVAEDVVERAVAVAKGFAPVNLGAYRATKKRVRGEALARIAATIDSVPADDFGRS